MKPRFHQQGQALILIALAAIGLFAFAALAIDGSRVYSDKRQAQNAADAAALAGALAYTRENTISDSSISSIAQTRATSNGYDNDGSTNKVTVSAVDVPATSSNCPGDTAGKDVTVTIVSYVDTTIARVIGRNQITNAVTATSRACGYYLAPLLNDNPIIGLNPHTTSCAFDSGNSNSAKWKIKGGGVFSNGCAFAHDSDSVILLDDGACITSVGTASGFECARQNQTSQAIKYPEDVLKIMPPNPCDGDPTDVGKAPPANGSTFKDGVYCIPNFDAYDQKDIILENATLYITDIDFNLKFAGGGGFSGTGTQSVENGGGYPGSEDYEGYYMIIAYDDTIGPCESFTDNHAQVIQWRGNGLGSFSGTVLAPSACLDLRGNPDQSAMYSQIIAYNVGSNGTADVYINYKEDQNRRSPKFPTISVLR